MSDPTTAETPTMRERLARALASECFGNHISPGGSINDYVHDCWPDYLDRVDAILREMLEPSKGMLAAGDEAGCEADRRKEVPWPACWQAMIQHILNETQEMRHREERVALDARLSGRAKAPFDPDDYGAPHLNETQD